MLTGKVALVTGGSRGIGRAIACALAREGALVLVNYNGSRERALEVVAQIEQEGGSAEAVGCDVSNFEACGKMIEEAVAKHFHIDILVNNAGVTRDGLIMRMSEADYDQVLDTNLKGAFNTIRHLSRQLLKQKSGKIINISSVSGILGNAGQANYSASKAGLIGLTKSVARELASRGICVNAVAPGFVDTEWQKTKPAEIRRNIENKVSLGRFCDPDELAEVYKMLIENSYFNGEVVVVDGGYSYK